MSASDLKGGTLQQQQQQQQLEQHQQQEQLQEPDQQQGQAPQRHDVYLVLRLVLSSLDDSEQRTCARYLARASRSARAVAIATLKQLPLTRYWLGRKAARAILEQPVSSSSSSGSSASATEDSFEEEEEAETDGSSVCWVTTDGSSDGPEDTASSSSSSSSSSSREDDLVLAAADKAAALPRISWRLLADLADAGTLTSLDVSAPQASDLLPWSTTDNTPAAAAAAPRLSAFLAGLRSLAVRDIETEITDVQRLICSCSGITELELEISVPAYSMRDKFGLTASVFAASSGIAGWHLPHLRRLAMYGGPAWLVNGWLDRIGPAKLTAVKLEHQAATGVDLARLAACTQLQELVLRHVSKHHWGVRKGRALSRLLLQLTSLTRFEVLGAEGNEGPLDGQVPPGVWGLAQLRDLKLWSSWQFQELPSAISSMRHLTHLCICGSGIRQLPHQLGAWLPQLECIDADDTALAAIPAGLSRLTWLCMECCRVTSVAAVSHLVSLQELRIAGNHLRSQFGSLAHLLSLRTLVINNPTNTAVGIPSPLPFLSFLWLAGSRNQVQVISELVGSGRHLKRMELYGLPQEEVEAFGQLGVLPVLQNLSLCRCRIESLAPASTWLQQQTQLTSLFVASLVTDDGQRQRGLAAMIRALAPPSRTLGGMALGAIGVRVPQLGPLPAGLQRLCLYGADVWEDASVRESLVALTGLRVLKLKGMRTRHRELPAWVFDWVLSLERMEDLGLGDVTAGHPRLPALAQLPMLRDVHADVVPEMESVLPAAFHLYWLPAGGPGPRPTGI